MSVLAKAFEQIRRSPWGRPNPALLSLERYILDGGDANRRAILKYTPPQGYGGTGADTLIPAIARPSRASEQDRRAIEGLLLAGFDAAAGAWFARSLESESGKEDVHASFCGALKDAGREPDLLPLMGRHLKSWARNGRPTSSGRALLAMSDPDLLRIAEAAAVWNPIELADFLLGHAPGRLEPVLKAMMTPDAWNLADLCALLAEKSGRKHERAILEAMRIAKYESARFRIGCVLHALAPDVHREMAVDAALKNRQESGPWLLHVLGVEAIPHIRKVLTSPLANAWIWRRTCEEILSAAARILGPKALPLFDTAAKSANEEVSFLGLTRLVELADPSTAGFVRAAILRGFAHSDPGFVARFAALAGKSTPRDFETELWGLASHASRAVRSAATQSLKRVGEPARARAVTALADRKAEVRLAAAAVLSSLGSAEAELEARLDEESSDDVRDALVEVLDRARAEAGRPPTKAEVEARIARAEAKMKKPPAPWAVPEGFAKLHFMRGAALDQRAVRYLFYRQARCAEIRPDLEVRALLGLIDRRSSGDFAMDVFRAFMVAGARAQEKWALALAALLGDRRVVVELARATAEWADTARNALGVAGSQALALQGSDEALMSLDTLAIRYRSKRKIVSEAAREAFEGAAETLGVSPAELGDRVVPWLNFEPGKPRLLAAGERQLQVTVGTDFKLRFRDLSTGKSVASLPKTVSAESTKEIKDLAAALRDAAKSQSVRMEQLLVQQRRWTEPRWRELFLRHPLLVPFAVRHVWGIYSADGTLQGTFRAMEDLTLTESEEETSRIPRGSHVGLVHPLELAGADVEKWRTHLADHEVEPVFAQLDRPVARPSASALRNREYDGAAGKSVVGIAFRGRMERLGWRHGPVEQGGNVFWYMKPFSGSGVDGLLTIEGMYMGIGDEASVRLGMLRFVKSGGKSSSDEAPEGPDDPRVVPLGQVPAIVYSETVSDLPRISGESVAEED